MPKRRKSSKSWRPVVAKLAKIPIAKSNKARVNFLIDAFADESLKNPYFDEALHFANEMILGKGTNSEKFDKWFRKVKWYRLKQK